MSDDREYTTVLVAEDDEMIRETLQELLENEGYRVLAAENGAQAIQILESESNPPRLILLDMFMPIMDGWRFLDRLKRFCFQLKENIPVVIISAAGERAKETAKQVNGFIKKPIDLEQLLTTVAEYCDSQKSFPFPESFAEKENEIGFGAMDKCADVYLLKRVPS